MTATKHFGNATHYQGTGRAVRVWLVSMAVLVFVMVIVGGATRLTDSGLSITEWKPILGAIPPLSDADWQTAFAKYRQIPEYQEINRGMSLEAFKFIYWWEWAHRFLGRFIGVAFFVPLVVFWVRDQIPSGFKARLVGLFILGGLQGALGWFMVQSGLVDRVDVSQYRLAAHLTLALVIYGAIVWTVLDLMPPGPQRRRSIRHEALALSAAGLVLAVYLQIALGAFVAGMRAGLSHNTWPLMDGAFIPDGLFVMQPWWTNFFENALTVQFDHRIAAYALSFWALAQAVWAVRAGAPATAVKSSAYALAAAVLLQFALGVWTLLAHVPLALGLAHQAGAIIVLTLALWHAHAMLGARSQAAG